MSGLSFLGEIFLWFWIAAGTAVLLFWLVLVCTGGLFALGDHYRRLRSGDRMALACSISTMIMLTPLLAALVVGRQ